MLNPSLFFTPYSRFPTPFLTAILRETPADELVSRRGRSRRNSTSASIDTGIHRTLIRGGAPEKNPFPSP